MSNELRSSGLVSGSAYYAVVRNAAGQYYTGSGFEAYTQANWSTYAVSSGTANTAGDWTGTFPVVGAGVYSVSLRLRVGGSPAYTDATVRSGTMVWDGTAEVTAGSLPTTEQLDAIQAKTDLITSEGVRYIGAYANGVITLRRGDSYGVTTGRVLLVPKPQGESWPALTDGWAIAFHARLKDVNAATGQTSITKTATIISDTSFRIDLTSAETAALDLGPAAGTGSKGGLAWEWEAEATQGSLVNTLISGSMSVLKDL